MLNYALRRILYGVPVLILSTFLSFCFISLAGDPRQNLLANPNLSRVHYHALYFKYHLNASIPVRYWYWLEDVFTHRLGRSLLTSQPIWPDLVRVLGHTLQIVILADGLALVLGIAVGVLSAVKQYSLFDYVFTTISFLGFAMPTFWLALLLQVLFTNIYLRWNVRIFYTSGLNSGVSADTWSLDRLQHIALPALTLAIISFALYSRFVRAAMLDVIGSDYVRTARAKGIPERLVIGRHVLRNALIPLVTVAALNLSGLLGGAIITETVFSIDGMGYYFVTRLGQLDLYAVMAYLAVTAFIIILFNLLADLVYGLLDPRIRYD
ncbi:MAG: ABC transporter permease [Actinobacteria bacterium]|nr:ABC transporter permease [Actinomycetota bacterium]